DGDPGRLARPRGPLRAGPRGPRRHGGYLCPGEPQPRPRSGDAGGRGTMTNYTETRPVIVCDGLVKIYKVADLEVVALQGLDLVVEPGEFVAIVGASGSGKSTLLNILGGLDTPSAGTVHVAGIDLLNMTPRQRTRYRRSVIGFIRQQTSRNLFPYLNAVENVELPMIIDGRPSREWRGRAMEQ